MGPVPDENQNNPRDNDPPNHSDSEELESPNHVIPPAQDFSSDDDAFGSDDEGPTNDGYMLLPQEPDEEGSGDTFTPQPFPPLPALDAEILSTELMTEVRGAGVDLSEAVAEGNVHPAFAANFSDNKVPVHLQVPDLPKTKKDEVLWNRASPAADRLKIDSVHLSKVKSAMAGFQLPKANIPDWAKQIPEDQWKQQLVDNLASPAATSAAGRKKPSTDIAQFEDSGTTDSSWPGTSGT